MDVLRGYTEVLIRWMDRIAAGEPPLIFGDGTQTMDFVYVDDIARANILAAKLDVTDDVFNVASGTETSLNDLAAALLRRDGRRRSARVPPGAEGQPGAAPARRHRRSAPRAARLRGRGRPRRGPSRRWSTGGASVDAESEDHR